MPTRIVFHELGESVPATLPRAEQYDSVWLIACLRGMPVGRVVINNCRTPVTADQMQSEIMRQLAIKLRELPDLLLDIRTHDLEARALLPVICLTRRHKLFLRVVVCTYDQPDDLRLCLHYLTALTTRRRQMEVIVVDKHPESGLTLPIVRTFPTVRYEVEHAHSVMCAQHHAIQAGHGNLVAYIVA